MKKLISIAAVAFAATTMAFAAPVISIRGNIGEALGSELNGFTKDSNNSRYFMDNLFYGAGAGLNFTLNGSIGIQPEVNYMFNNLGSRTTGTLSIAGVTTTTTSDSMYTYSSIDIPVLLTLRANKFNLAVGPYASIPVSTLLPNGKTRTVRTSSSSTSDKTTPVTGSEIEISNKVIFGITGGLEYEERMGVARLVYGARYICDFSPVCSQTTDFDGNVTSTTEYFTRRGLIVTVGLKAAL